ncbi:hypothetical protein M422DRAFT_264779 [Sphaerobolus stellatus SS14]|uniref:Uncharacterized protein n=1 Tax=Sphaerobolus stellatus (strain SS14) TaxID=990650 RepID=A0A0C9TSH9_SPHS4|nr:hypothetical protein M422DRAFT_264779 [Sphaerobolus stellatus SS14]
MDPRKDPSQTASTVSEANTIHPTTWNTRATDELAHPASDQGTSEDPTRTPNPHGGSGDPLLPKNYSDYAEPKMLDTINEHMDEVTSIHNMSCQAAQLLAKTNERNSALEARTRTLRTRLIAIWEKYLAIAKGKLSSRPRDTHKDPYNEDIDPHPERPSNWLNVDEESTTDPIPLGKARTELLAKTAILAPAYHLKQAATAAQNTHMEYERLLRLSKVGLLNPQDQQQSIQPIENARENLIRDKPRESV